MKIGILGAGNVGGELGRLWAAKGHEIVFGVPDPNKPAVATLVQRIGGRARAASVSAAATFGEVVVLAVPWPAAEQAIRSAGDLGGKTLIDCTNPLSADISGLTVGTSDSAGEQVCRWAKGAHVVKAFNTIGAPNFANPRFGEASASMFIAGDDGPAKAVVSRLAAELGFDVVDTGPLKTARWLEGVGMLWIHLAFGQGWGPASHGFKLLRR
ncbi:MAG: NADPH-dependent F420 reductase [Steroidobacteraceae bacterium]